jgi:hypothetical protein
MDAESPGPSTNELRRDAKIAEEDALVGQTLRREGV